MKWGQVRRLEIHLNRFTFIGSQKWAKWQKMTTIAVGMQLVIPNPCLLNSREGTG